jgi:hypothetical protein
MYNISDKTYQIANEMGLQIFPSDNPNKKLEVYDKKTGNFLFYAGASDYMDYHMYLAEEKKGLVPKGTADKRRKLYHIRHQKDIEMGRKGYVVSRLLW